MKSVAVIGAGPAGLVAAKTLLHLYPKRTFDVSIFEESKNLGGLWAVEANPKYRLINPDMNTNLSQFTVCFSDLAWDTLELQPPPNIFPKAWQVDRYLEAYAQRFVPGGVVQFHTRVINAKRTDHGWSITTTNLESKVEEVKIFDYLLIASGLFSKPAPINFSPDGMETDESPVPILHSSKFRRLEDLSSTGQQPSRGKILVVGGSHSGAEVAANIALQMSDRHYSLQGSGMEPLEIIHVAPYPINALPPFVQPGNGSPPTFLPLDTLLNDLSSRKDDPISFTIEHPTLEKFMHRENLMKAVMYGTKEEDGAPSLEKEEVGPLKASYGVVSDYYAKFVESSAITQILGRVGSIGRQKDDTQSFTSLAQATVIQASGEVQIEGICTIVNATGFSTSPALDFLSNDLKNSFGFDASFPRLPLLLNREASTSSDGAPNNLAPIGFSHGGYWGILETQARMIARKWSLDNPTSLPDGSKPDKNSKKLSMFMQELRSKMKDDPFAVAQNFLGDYTGFMEEYSRELDLQRVELKYGAREGMVSPARYIDDGCDRAEAEKTMGKIQSMVDASARSNAFTARATFTSLLGNWTVKKEGHANLMASFHPRYPTASNIDLEYLYILETKDSGAVSHSGEVERLVYRLRELGNEIEVWDVFPGVRESLAAESMRGKLEFGKAIHSNDKCLSVTMETSGKGNSAIYSFFFSGIQVPKFSTQSQDGKVELEFFRLVGDVARGRKEYFDKNFEGF